MYSVLLLYTLNKYANFPKNNESRFEFKLLTFSYIEKYNFSITYFSYL